MSTNEIWNSRGTMSRARVSIWESAYKKRLLGSVGRKHKILMNVGHYGNVGYSSPSSGDAFKVEFGHYGSKRRRMRGKSKYKNSQKKCLFSDFLDINFNLMVVFNFYDSFHFC